MKLTKGNNDKEGKSDMAHMLESLKIYLFHFLH
jgi:hypothetical protein